MAVETIEDITDKKPTAYYPVPWKSRIYAFVCLLFLLIVVIIASSTVGSTHISLTHTLTESSKLIIFHIRLPRIIMAGLVGAALSVAGATYQGLFRNPLADPYLIGVAQGAGLGAVIGFLLPVSLQLAAVPIMAFAGAVLAVVIVYSIARVGKSLPMTTLILAGVALGAFLGAITSYLMIASGDQLHSIVLWLLGTLSVTNWSQVIMVAPYIIIGTIVIWCFARPLNVMQLDEEQAQQLGINVETVKIVLLAAATLITAAAISFCGIIGFVGIIVPHAIRLIWGPDHRFLLPLSTVAGAIFLILADTAARTLLSPTEIPIGVITAFIGAPFFLYLLRQKKRAIF
jgi:iron complex transport system permease protein